MAVDCRYSQGGTADVRPLFDYARYRAKIRTVLAMRLHGISSNYATGWTTGDVDFY